MECPVGSADIPVVMRDTRRIGVRRGNTKVFSNERVLSRNSMLWIPAKNLLWRSLHTSFAHPARYHSRNPSASPIYFKPDKMMAIAAAVIGMAVRTMVLNTRRGS
jgi:hypothetical protein